MATPTSDIPQKWASAWSGDSISAWQALYSPTAIYTDHAFQIVRQGRETLGLHWNIWRTAIPDFQLTIAETFPAENLSDGKVRYSIRTNNSGTFVKDLPSRKARGRKFHFRAVVDLVVNAEGLIESVEEWYCSNFDEKESVEGYHYRGDEGMAKGNL